jgi:flagellar biosynthesis protein
VTGGDTRRRRVAAAIRHSLGQSGRPVVAAAGHGAFADAIVDVARTHGVGVHEDADLAELLAALGTGASIPPEVILAVAEVLANLYAINEARRHGQRR